MPVIKMEELAKLAMEATDEVPWADWELWAQISMIEYAAALAKKLGVTVEV